MCREVFLNRPDVNAVVHLHPNVAISYFAVLGNAPFQFISIDAPLVMGKDVLVLDPSVDVEADASRVGGFIAGTNCFVMPHHGVTTLGRNLSEAYHRMTTLVSEVERLRDATLLAGALGRPIPLISTDLKRELYRSAERILHGEQP